MIDLTVPSEGGINHQTKQTIFRDIYLPNKPTKDISFLLASVDVPDPIAQVLYKIAKTDFHPIYVAQ